jgi:hypothetical protein
MTYTDTLDRGCTNPGCFATWTAGETHDCRSAVRDSLAHSYYSEVDPPRQPIEPVTFNRRDLLEIVVGVPVLGALLFGIPFLLFLVAQP